MTQPASLKLRREDSLKTWRLQVAVLLAGHATEGVVAHAKELVLPHDLGHLTALLHLCDRVSYDIFVIELNAPLATTGELRVRRATRLAHYLLDATPHGGLRVCRAHGGHGPQIHTVEGVEKRLHFAPLCVRAPRWIRVPLLPAGSLGPEGLREAHAAHWLIPMTSTLCPGGENLFFQGEKSIPGHLWAPVAPCHRRVRRRSAGGVSSSLAHRLSGGY